MAFIGDTVRLIVKFKTFEGQTIDPIDVRLKIFSESEQTIEEFQLNETNRLEIGVFYFDYIVPVGEGNLIYEFSGMVNSKPIITRGTIERRFI